MSKNSASGVRSERHFIFLIYFCALHSCPSYVVLVSAASSLFSCSACCSPCCQYYVLQLDMLFSLLPLQYSIHLFFMSFSFLPLLCFPLLHVVLLAVCSLFSCSACRPPCCLYSVLPFLMSFSSVCSFPPCRKICCQFSILLFCMSFSLVPVLSTPIPHVFLPFLSTPVCMFFS